MVSLCPVPRVPAPSLHLLSVRTCQFLFYIFPHFSQDNAWDYDPATQVWGCRDSGGCSYYCHWCGSGKSPHLSGNAGSDSTNTPPLTPHPSPLTPHPHTHSLSFHTFLRHNCKITTAVVFIQRAQANAMPVYITDVNREVMFSGCSFPDVLDFT